MMCFAEVFPPGVKAFVSLRPNSAYSYLFIRSMPFAENISILQERSGGAVRVFVDIRKFPAFKVSTFEKFRTRLLGSYSGLLSTSSSEGSQAILRDG